MAGIAAGQASENSREACTIEYVTVIMVTKCGFHRNFRITLLFLSTGYMEGPSFFLPLWLSEKFSEARIKPGINPDAGSRAEHSATPHLSLSWYTSLFRYPNASLS